MWGGVAGGGEQHRAAAGGGGGQTDTAVGGEVWVRTSVASSRTCTEHTIIPTQHDKSQRGGGED